MFRKSKFHNKCVLIQSNVKYECIPAAMLLCNSNQLFVSKYFEEVVETSKIVEKIVESTDPVI